MFLEARRAHARICLSGANYGEFVRLRVSTLAAGDVRAQ
jgi:hypothetical protein